MVYGSLVWTVQQQTISVEKDTKRIKTENKLGNQNPRANGPGRWLISK
uniref:Uncharacterized protein n=1 Tax=Rhizophora mucronata TaxID=61149 RepID=A0A2P2MHN3_RHIMU